MKTKQRPLRYGFATLVVATTIGLLFIPGMGQALAGLLFFAVMLSAWYGGLGPGLMAPALVVGFMLGVFAYVGERIPASQVWSLAIFAGLSVLLAFLVESMHAARRKVEERERWVSTALRSIGDAVIATDDAGRVVFVNPVAEALTGWSHSEARGKPLPAVFPIVNEKTRCTAEDPVAKVFATGRTAGLANHTLLIARDGTETPIDDSAAPIIDDSGRVEGVILVFRDVAERRRTDELKERLAAIVESSNDVILSKTLDGIITSWNRGAEHVLGYTADEVVGRHVSMLMPPESIEDTERILGAIRRGERVEHYQAKRRRKDGTIIDVSLTVSPIRDSDGEIIGASKTGRDITELKRIEAERAEADRRKDEFLAMLAHELRNPLASITNAVRLFGKLESEHELEWAKDVVLRHVKHLTRLIEDLLDVSRITRGKISLSREEFDLREVVAAAVEAVRPLIEERGHDLSISLDRDVSRLDADPVRVEQILVNLLTNAAKYTDEGGRIALAVRREGDEVVIRVRDTGIGIAPDLLPRVFDLFTQGDRSIARSEGGLGIGLTLVKRLAEMHGGTITVASPGPGQGSAFTVRLPAKAGHAADGPAPEPPAPRAPRARSRVLVVDDNVDTARGLSRLLKLQGHDVLTVHDGPAALEAASSHRPEVVLLDIGLPGMDGYQVARRLRGDGFGDCLIIAVSGYGQEEDRRRSREAGFDHHLVKPLDYDTLTSMMAQTS